ncbi:hypothetical protein [Leptospira neocaledonica]|uniref:DUF1311 domain-containing protein n=1 Tax=Leptospira neocaledonica TaxID=2023192 RepID=A0A2M9ZUE1_9LEPT|nr:hypothetical protein [Leptospira neocaledonica]PJZ75614.1 hypothetical protein CH365_17880 [Leptospira neocaledonica]
MYVKRIVFPILIIFLLSSHLFAGGSQNSAQQECFQNFIRACNSGFDCAWDTVESAFKQDLSALGKFDEFRLERCVSDNIHKRFWLSAYIHSNPTTFKEPERSQRFTLNLTRKVIGTCERNKIQCKLQELHFIAAVNASKLGNSYLASYHKERAIQVANTSCTYFGAKGQEEADIFQSIKTKSALNFTKCPQ